ncbi:MAG: hypothetical protein ACJKTH_00170 [Patescibacteria group bacterium UBA2163]
MSSPERPGVFSHEPDEQAASSTAFETTDEVVRESSLEEVSSVATVAGTLEKSADSAKAESLEGFFVGVTFDSNVSKSEVGYHVALAVSVASDPAPFSYTLNFTAPDSEEGSYLEAYLGDHSDITIADLRELGIVAKEKQYTIDGVLVERRFNFNFKSIEETCIVTLSHEDHWQNSHSHEATAESYGVVQGTLVLVEQNPENDGVLLVQAVSKTDSGWRTVTFSLDTRTGEEMVHDVTEHEAQPFLPTSTGIAHNVFLEKDTVITTGKIVDTEKEPVEGVDWKGEPDFDEVLNTDPSEGEVVSSEIILEKVRRHLGSIS